MFNIMSALFFFISSSMALENTVIDRVTISEALEMGIIKTDVYKKINCSGFTYVEALFYRDHSHKPELIGATKRIKKGDLDSDWVKSSIDALKCESH